MDFNSYLFSAIHYECFRNRYMKAIRLRLLKIPLCVKAQIKPRKGIKVNYLSILSKKSI